MPNPPGEAAIESELVCGGCGHNLRGASGRCPECGRSFNPERLIDELIPWERRTYAGRIQTYLATAHIATFRPQQFGRHTERPVSWRSARLFRRVTVLLAAGPIVLVASASHEALREIMGPCWDAVLENRWGFAALLAGVFVGILVAARLTSWPFFDRRLSRELRGRAVAMGCYACAPLLYIGLICLLFALQSRLTVAWDARSGLAGSMYNQFRLDAWLAPAFISILVLPSLCSVLVLLRTSTKFCAQRLVWAALLLPGVWVLSPAVCAGAFESLVAIGLLFLRSLS